MKVLKVFFKTVFITIINAYVSDACSSSAECDRREDDGTAGNGRSRLDDVIGRWEQRRFDVIGELCLQASLSHVSQDPWQRQRTSDTHAFAHRYVQVE